MKLEVNTGDRYNHYTIIREVPKKGDGRRFLCRCDCGNEKEVDIRNLRNGHIKSCGKCNYTEIKIGDKFGHWTVIGDYKKSDSSYHREYLCECDCQNKTQRYVDEQNLKRGNSTSCGCETIKTTKMHFIKHGDSGTRLFSIWSLMKQRCHNPNVDCFSRYGGRGIKVCKKWMNSYESFKEWALSHGYRDDLTIDRIDVNGNYCPENCRWATIKEQNNNRRSNVFITYNGEKHNTKEWSDITGIKAGTIRERYKKGYPLEDVFFCGKFDAKGRRII